MTSNIFYRKIFNYEREDATKLNDEVVAANATKSVIFNSKFIQNCQCRFRCIWYSIGAKKQESDSNDEQNIGFVILEESPTSKIDSPTPREHQDIICISKDVYHMYQRRI